MLLFQYTVGSPKIGYPNNGSVIKGARLIQSEGQAKLYFAPSIKNQTDRQTDRLGLPLPLTERATPPCFPDNFYRTKAMWLGLATQRWLVRLQYTEKAAQSC